MPSVGTVSAIEAAWVIGFLYALFRALGEYRVMATVRRERMDAGVDSRMDLFFLRLSRLLVGGSVAGLVPAVYAAFLPPGGAEPGTPLSAMAGVLLPVSLCMLAAAFVGIAAELHATYERITQPPKKVHR